MEKLLKKGKRGEIKFILRPKYDKGELAKEILRGLAVGGILLSALAVPNVASLARLFEPADRRKIRRVLASLKRERFVRLVSSGNTDCLEVTESGRKKLLAYNADELVLNTGRHWDGRWRLVLFDIPERFVAARHALQFKLGRLGFYRYQKSVYVTPHRCRDEIDFLTEFFEVGKYVKYFEVADLPEEIKLIHRFGLRDN